MVTEIVEFIDEFDAAYMIARNMAKKINCSITVYMYTDWKKSFDAMTKGRRTAERKLMVDIAAARKTYKAY